MFIICPEYSDQIEHSYNIHIICVPTGVYPFVKRSVFGMSSQYTKDLVTYVSPQCEGPNSDGDSFFSRYSRIEQKVPLP